MRNDDAGFAKVRILLQLDKKGSVAEHLSDNLERYSLGKVRTIDQFFKHTGIDPELGVVTRDFCKVDQINVDKLSFNATKSPIRKIIEGFVSEGSPVPSVVEVDAWRDARGNMRLDDPAGGDIHTYRMVLFLWCVIGSMLAWMLVAKYRRP